MPPKKRPARTKPEYSSVVPAVEQASRILLALAQNRSGRMTLTEIAGTLGIHKSKGYSILNTLQHFAFVQRSSDDKSYSLGPGLLFLSSKVLSNLDMREAVAPILHELAFETNSTALLGIIAEGHVFVAAKDEGPQDIGVMIRLGHRFPLTWGAHGKAIVSFLPEAERNRVLQDLKPYFHGDPSRFDRHRLDQEMADCRETGFAWDLGDMKGGVHAVASPVLGPSGRLVGALAVIGTFPRDDTAKYGRDVARAARHFSATVSGVPEVSVRQSLGTQGIVPDNVHTTKKE